MGFLDFRKNFTTLTIAAIMPGDLAGRPAVLFPGPADVVHKGDKLLSPIRFKDVEADAQPFTAEERRAISETSRKALRALKGGAFKDSTKLFSEGKAKRAT